jgi:sporulation protein YabP
METTTQEKFLVKIEDGKYLYMNTVTHIVAFAENEVVLCTHGGRLNIEGSDLKIESLDKNRGEITVTGKIESLSLSEKREEHGGLFARIFK